MLKILFCLLIKSPVRHLKDFPDGSVIKNPPANAADMGSQRVRLDLVTQHAYKTFKIVQRSFEKLGVYGQLIKIR